MQKSKKLINRNIYILKYKKNKISNNYNIIIMSYSENIFNFLLEVLFLIKESRIVQICITFM
ncbi:hypothetical protein PFAG_04539 [Plasmodium falciparum Santa Lucia]|uniref:Uncharacterized protein n=10 Tax=Plasmodium falciparum TaxID=5833 RepID=W7KB00_PLAFO|nr:hypothetical protein PFFVO_04143 [Plasmodium falciparum Vietnam Oak-Knoll (FVO)]ETW34824.1 hypothetical protein PFTANZ_04491 [Plasmodium falciparum Tanzania (2000708)]ETW41070.1 hypothetical protein PFNF135_04704 [Plasmodium falciparum NF135/5.C10]ETW47535.1 hypothetical protein PFMALIP_04397 [Plasmodium falciparum MaliPS096_E11]ETW54574.1 hypothetical protein PFUGPA_03182 [Plasmodium falciparum Palo Alto/Uganda]ETW59694.1 hypothetical protein PFMC_04503 [Plasmodium falciparum CAMP/Malaysia